MGTYWRKMRRYENSKRKCKSAVIRQNGESQNRCFKKTKHAKFSEKRTFLTPWYAHVSVRIRGQEMFVFQKISRALFSCKHPLWDSPFCLKPDQLNFSFCGRNMEKRRCNKKKYRAIFINGNSNFESFLTVFVMIY